MKSHSFHLYCIKKKKKKLLNVSVLKLEVYPYSKGGKQSTDIQLFFNIFADPIGFYLMHNVFLCDPFWIGSNLIYY